MNQTIEILLADLRERVEVDPHLSGRDLLEMVRPSVRLETRRVSDAEIRIGDSRIAGVPDVPAGFEWPRWAPVDDRYGEYPEGPVPLGFIAQIDLSRIPPVGACLPQSGWLYFFFDRCSEPWGNDPSHRGSCRVVYADCARSDLERMQPPPDAAQQHAAGPCLVEAWAELTLPDEVAAIEYGTPAYDAYHQLQYELIRDGRGTVHRLLGHAQAIQNPMERECQLASNGIRGGGVFQQEKVASLEAGVADWHLLLQIDTDVQGPGWSWGDVGRIYFWIKQQDLAKRWFDDVWLIFQCC